MKPQPPRQTAIPATLFKVVSYASAAGAVLMSGAYVYLFYLKKDWTDSALAAVYLFIALIIFPPTRRLLETKIYKRALAPQELLRLYFILFTFSLIVTWFAGRNKSAEAESKAKSDVAVAKSQKTFTLLAAAKKDLYWGYVDIQGKWAIAPRFENAYPFSNQRAAVLTGEGYRFIRPDGAFAFAEAFTDAVPFACGRAAVATRKGWGYIDTAGKAVTPFAFEKASDFSDDRAWAEKSGAYFIVAPDGKTVEVTEITAYAPFYKGKAAVRNKNARWGLLDESGKWTVAPAFDSLLSAPDGKFFPAKKGDKWGYVSETGEWILSPRYIAAFCFAEGKAAVQTAEGWGYIDNKGDFILKPAYILAFDFIDGLAFVRTKEGAAVIDDTGNKISGDTLKVAPLFRKPVGRPLLPVIKNSSLGVIDEKGRYLVPPAFDDIKAFSKID